MIIIIIMWPSRTRQYSLIARTDFDVWWLEMRGLAQENAFVFSTTLDKYQGLESPKTTPKHPEMLKSHAAKS